MKKFLVAMFLAVTMLVNVASAAPAKMHTPNRETIYQIALLQSLAMGYFDGSITVGELKKHGDIGIGTFEGLNGEMIVLDGVVYRANRDCKINVMADKEGVPFSNVTFFDKDFSVKLTNVADKAAFEKILNEHVNKHGRNSFYMVKVTGTFNEILIRSESGCEEPYPTLVEALKTQNEISPRNISGTMVGLYCPDFMNSLNSTGWHFHFISADKKIGGHVLEVDLKNGEAQFDKTDAFKMDLPTKENFHALNFKTNMTEDIRKAEQDSQR